MKRPSSKVFSRGATIFLVILGVYFLVSTLSLTILSGHLDIEPAGSSLLSSRLPFHSSTKSFGDKLPFLSTWPTPCRELPHLATISA